VAMLSNAQIVVYAGENDLMVPEEAF